MVDRQGVAGMVRFIQQYEQGEGDYTKERHEWVDSMTKEQFLKEIQELRVQKAKANSGSKCDDDMNQIKEQVLREGIKVLKEKLGVVRTLQFLMLYDRGEGDYTQERRKGVESMTIEEIIQRVEKKQSEDPSTT